MIGSRLAADRRAAGARRLQPSGCGELMADGVRRPGPRVVQRLVDQMTEPTPDSGFDAHLARALAGTTPAEAEACPDAEVLAGWLDGTLDAATLQACEAHAASCTRCQAVLATVARAESFSSRPIPAREAPPMAADRLPSRIVPFRWRRLAWVAGPVALAASVLLAVWIARPPTDQGPGTTEPPPTVVADSSVAQAPPDRQPVPETATRDPSTQPRTPRRPIPSRRTQRAGSGPRQSCLLRPSRWNAGRCRRRVPAHQRLRRSQNQARTRRQRPPRRRPPRRSPPRHPASWEGWSAACPRRRLSHAKASRPGPRRASWAESSGAWSAGWPAHRPRLPRRLRRRRKQTSSGHRAPGRPSPRRPVRRHPERSPVPPRRLSPPRRDK